MQDAVARLVDEHRHCHGFQAPVVLVGLELVEQEATLPGSRLPALVHQLLVELAAVLAVSFESPGDRGPIAAQVTGALTLGDLRDQQQEDGDVEPRTSQAIVDAKRLRRERALATHALEARDHATVARAFEGASALVLKPGAGLALRGLARAEARLELHGSI